MRLEHQTLRLATLVVAVYAFWLPGRVPAQVPAEGNPTADSQPAIPAVLPDSVPSPGAIAGSATPVASLQKTYTVPAGTKILLQLRSALNTKSAKAGDGVYLTSSFPVVVGNRVMIPAGVFVQGMVDRVVRA